MASECSSGCESGWTSYLEQSLSHKSKGFNHKKKSFCDEYRKGKGIVVGFKDGDDDDDEDEDLSMVSDASSGPPHFYEDNGNYFNDHQYSVVPKGNTTTTTLNKNGGKRHRNKQQQQQHQRQREDHQEDDTASSPLINFSKNNFAQTNNPQGFSATHFQGGPAFQDHFGFLQSSPSGNHLQQQQGHQWF